jgi:hypothetical protein
MSKAYIVALAFLFIALIALAVAWWYARRVKQGLDEESRVIAGARSVVDLSAASVEQLRRLSADPILLKQAEEGVRVQIDHRPMMPLMAFIGRDVSAALNETAAAVTQHYGMRWVVLVTPAGDDRVSVQRLA